jgi:shikimate dehydrogenase
VTGRTLAVLGSPIAHSKSPDLHAAAYGVLGLDWQYTRHEVTAEGLAGFVAALGEDWRGLSLTMPLKEAALQLSDWADEPATRSGAANTMLLESDGGRRVWNTDIGGFARALEARGVPVPETALLLGTGATARSALLALHDGGARSVLVAGRTPDRVDDLIGFAESIGFSASANPGGLEPPRWPDVGLVVSTLPATAELDLPEPPSVPLFDVAYGGASPVSALWRRSQPAVPMVDGLDLLVEQALLQVRIFVGGDIALPLASEAEVLRAMNAAVGRS